MPLIAASLALLNAFEAAAAQNDRGAPLAAMCASCHRLDGNVEGIPSIAGRGEDSLVAAICQYTSGKRKSQPMHAVAATLSDEEIAAVARYLAARETGRKRQ